MSHHSPPIASSRRQFLAGCAACIGCTASSALLAPRPARAATAADGKPKVRLVFCETQNDKPIWPNIGYDFDAPRNRVLKALEQGCPEVQFLPVRLMDDPKQAAEVLQGDAEVQGYLICLQGLGWGNDIVKLSATGKPTLLVDNLFGGSGLLLTRLPQIMTAGKPVDWVSSARAEDMVAAARKFALLQSGKPAAEIAAAFRAARHERTPSAKDWTLKPDRVTASDFDKALQQLRQTRLLVVGGSGGDALERATQEVFGVQMLPISFEELGTAYAQADAKEAEPFAELWIKQAREVVEPSRDDIAKSAAMYVAMKQLIDKHGARGISVNCLGGFYGGHLKAYPCLGFRQMNDDGLVGGCEADRMSALTMAVIGALTGRPGYISDPVIDTSRNAIIYSHCVATTKPFGPDGPSNPYRLRNHSEDRKGASIQSLLPEGYLTTTLEINPQSRQVVMHQAKTIGNNTSDMACRTKLEAVVKGDLERLTESWRMGWHRVTFYGDLKGPVTEIAQRMKLQLIEEA